MDYVTEYSIKCSVARVAAEVWASAVDSVVVTMVVEEFAEVTAEAAV